MEKETGCNNSGKEAGASKTSEESKEELLLFEEIEIEELSIDGICGVY